MLKVIIHDVINIRGAFNKFPDIFVQAFKIVVDSRKFSMFLTLPMVQTFLPVAFGYSLCSEAVVMRQLRN